MALKDFIPTVWAARIHQAVEHNSSYVPLCDRSYEPQLQGSVGAVRIPLDATDVVTDTDDRPGRENFSDSHLGGVTLSADKTASFNVGVDDIEAAQSTPAILDHIVSTGMTQILRDIDKEASLAFSHIPANTLTGFSEDVGDNAFTKALAVAIEELHTRLNASAAPTFGRWALVERDIAAKISTLYPAAVEAPSARMGSFGFSNYLGNINGIEFYSDLRNARVAVPRSGKNYYDAVCSQGVSGVAFGMKVINIESLRSSKGFRSRVRALIKYGFATMDASRLFFIPIEQK